MLKADISDLNLSYFTCSFPFPSHDLDLWEEINSIYQGNDMLLISMFTYIILNGGEFGQGQKNYHSALICWGPFGPNLSLVCRHVMKTRFHLMSLYRAGDEPRSHSSGSSYRGVTAMTFSFWGKERTLCALINGKWNGTKVLGCYFMKRKWMFSGCK